MRYSALVILFIICISGCTKNVNFRFPDDGSPLQIRAGFACGWGSGEDSILITRSLIRYRYYIPARSSFPVINESRSVTDKEWVTILNSVDAEEFQKLIYNSCNICVDGCDEWIAIQTNEVSHMIRFPKGFQIDAIKELQDKLASLRTEFSKQAGL
jgi:hypothetical protein